MYDRCWICFFWYRGRFLDNFWTHFQVWNVFWGHFLTMLQHLRAILKKICVKMRTKTAKIEFSSNFASNLGPKWGVPTLGFWSIFGSWGVPGSKMAPRALPRTIWNRFCKFFGRFSIDFWCSCRRFFLHWSANSMLNSVCDFVPEVSTMSFQMFSMLHHLRATFKKICASSIHSQHRFIEARWRRWPEGQLDICYLRFG